METKNQISFSYEVNKKVSEELSSVETIEKYIIDYLKISKFQKNLVVWKHDIEFTAMMTKNASFRRT